MYHLLPRFEEVLDHSSLMAMMRCVRWRIRRLGRIVVSYGSGDGLDIGHV
jgi:hypothetical protein